MSHDKFKIFILLLNIFLRINCKNVTSDCKCMPYYQCTEDLNNLVTDGDGLFDVRGYKSGECNGYFDVCCNITISDVDKIETFEKLNGCGYQYSGLFPWSGALLYQENSLSPHKYKCGLSLIHRYVVITAAHCLNEDGGILTAHVGNVLTTIKQSIIHPEYNLNSLQNDIAILILTNPIEITDSINTICIPPAGIIVDNATCIVTAWNKNRFIKNPNLFLKLNVFSIVSRETCINSLRKTRLGPYFQLHKSFLCAGSKQRKDVCFGDGGSPLVCEIPGQPNRYHQVGIVSWGIGCGDNKTPGVYVNLALFRKWIDEEMIKLKYDINIYRY